MGSGASTNIKHEVQELVEGKPVDVTDIKDFESALQEIAKYRKLAGEFLIHQSGNVTNCRSVYHQNTLS